MKRELASRLLSTIIIFVIIYLLIFYGVSYAFGVEKPFMVVVSRSMEPTIHVNDLIIVSSVDIRDVKIGDIIVFKSPLNPNVYIVHRVIEIARNGDEIYLKTKGDNNLVPDPWTVDKRHLIGRVVYVIPYVGGLIRVLNENIALKIWIISLLILLLVYVEYREYIKRRLENIQL